MDCVREDCEEDRDERWEDCEGGLSGERILRKTVGGELWLELLRGVL